LKIYHFGGAMIIGIPKEIKIAEQRVSATPAGVRAFIDHGHIALVESSAGVGSGFSDKEYLEAGAKIIARAEDVWAESEMILKVKEPIGQEVQLIRNGQILFTYLHLAADRTLTEKLIESKALSIGYETVQLPDGSLPLLAPMSEVAGRLSIQMGAYCLEAKNGGLGILLSGVSGVRPARVTVIGGGVAGLSAAMVAVGMGATVSILDINPIRLRYIDDIMGGRLVTIMSQSANIEEECLTSHLVIGAVLIPGAKAPKLLTRNIVRRMIPGSAIVDIAVDQGGCCETTKPTSHHNPIYIEEGVVHYCVTNMPGAVPRTSTIALTNVTLSYALSLADKGLKALAEDKSLARGVNTYNGQLTCRPVAEAFGLKWSDPGF
jgi:alanine dehydrogenase